MKNITKGQLEAKICEEMVKSERRFMGKGPLETNTIIYKDAILVRLRSTLAPAEVHLAKTPEGVELIKKIRFKLLDGTRDILDSIFLRITGSKIISLHSDIGKNNGDKVIIFIPDRNLESQLKYHN